MKAFLLKGPYESEWVEYAAPKPGPDEVVIKVKAMGICGTDINIYHGTHGNATYPRIPGHEMVGEVVETGRLVHKVKVGDRVATDPVVSCGECAMCKAGRHNICLHVKCLGVQTDGGFAEMFKIRADRVYSFGADLAWRTAALLEPFSVAAQIVERLRINSDDLVLIIGGGTIGQAILQIIRQVCGAEGIISDIALPKLRLAEKFGARAVVNPQDGDVIARSMKIWGNRGPTVIVEAVGHDSKMLQEIIANAPAGCRIGILGFMPEPLVFTPLNFTQKELELVSGRMNNHKLPQVIKWFNEKIINPAMMITHTFRFEDAEHAFKQIDRGPDEVCKVVLEYD